MVAYAKLVPDNEAVACELPRSSRRRKPHTAPQELITSTVFQNPASSHTFIRKKMRDRDLPEKVINIIYLYWIESTTARYEGLHRKWRKYCSQRDVDSLVADVKIVLDFFDGMYKRECRYCGICAARSALSSAVTILGYERM